KAANTASVNFGDKFDAAKRVSPSSTAQRLAHTGATSSSPPNLAASEGVPIGLPPPETKSVATVPAPASNQTAASPPTSSTHISPPKSLAKTTQNGLDSMPRTALGANVAAVASAESVPTTGVGQETIVRLRSNAVSSKVTRYAAAINEDKQKTALGNA